MSLVKTKNILITGGAGYIGSAVSLYLLQQNYQVIILDLKKPENLLKNNLENLIYIQSDFADKETLNNIFNKYEIYAVMHFAAFIEVGESVKDPKRYYENNVIKTLKLLDVMLEFNVKKFIFSSSCAVYGIPEFLPLTEDHANKPISPYGKTKLIIEMVLQDYSKAYNINYVSLRYFNAAGAWPEFGLGENHFPETHVIPIILESAYNDKIFTIFGDNYDTPDGTCVRDYLHIKDLANAHFFALKYLEENNSSDVFNLGTGKGFSVKELIATAKKIIDKKIKINIIEKREGDPAFLIANSQKAQQILNWQPQYSNLDYIIETANQYYKKNVT